MFNPISSKNVILLIVVTIIIGGVFWAGYSYYRSSMVGQDDKQDGQQPDQQQQEEQEGEQTHEEQEQTLPESSMIDVEPIELSSVEIKKVGMFNYYSLEALSLKAQAPQYELPLNPEVITNFQDFSTKIGLSDAALSLLEKNGFVVIENPYNDKEEDITQLYENLRTNEIPIFVTSDSLLHIYHIMFDEVLRQIEERIFYDTIWEISVELFEDSILKHENAGGELKEALKRNIAYFAVGLNLLKPTVDQICTDEDVCSDPGLASAYFSSEDLDKYQFVIPDLVKSVVEEEVEFLERHEGFVDSPLFLYKEDYSQYVPRGHYTRSEKLKNYFRALMWYGRMSMLLKGTDEVEIGGSCDLYPQCRALVSSYDARIQTMQACLLAYSFAENTELMEKWDKMYSVTAYLIGFSDDLGVREYLEALDSVFQGVYDPNELTEENIVKIKAKLAEYAIPEIYGGTGEIAIMPPFTIEQVDEILEVTKGFRLMGSRYVPDSYIFQNLVVPNVWAPLGEDKPFTWGMTAAGPARTFPRGLDVMALLGSERAVQILDELKDSRYENYSGQFTILKQEFEGFSVDDWNKNLYFSWLYALKPLLVEYDEGYPTFMQSRAWQDKALTTALASWTELKHDTVLYAKQSYTPTVPAEPDESEVDGYVEPVPEFYNRLLALTRMTSGGLCDRGVLDASAQRSLEKFESLLETLILLSEKELKNEELTLSDRDFINNIYEKLNEVIEDVDYRSKKTTIVTDVHTDQNSGLVLQEGIGYVELLIVAYKVPDGGIQFVCGPVLSYYEFKQNIGERLTDELWRDTLSLTPLERPEWISNFTA